MRRARFIRYLISAVSSRENRSSRRVARATASAGKILDSARLTRWMEPSEAIEITPVGNAFEDRFGEAAAAVELAAVGFELRGHLVEGADQPGQFIDGADVHAVRQIALAHLARGMRAAP